MLVFLQIGHKRCQDVLSSDDNYIVLTVFYENIKKMGYTVSISGFETGGTDGRALEAR
jgi:hypothetical protein